MVNEYKKWTFENLGLSSLVEKHEKSPDFAPQGPPQETVDKTIEACMVERKRRQDARPQERMEHEFLYRAYHHVVDYRKKVF